MFADVRWLGELLGVKRNVPARDTHREAMCVVARNVSRPLVLIYCARLRIPVGLAGWCWWQYLCAPKMYVSFICALREENSQEIKSICRRPARGRARTERKTHAGGCQSSSHKMCQQRDNVRNFLLVSKECTCLLLFCNCPQI